MFFRSVLTTLLSQGKQKCRDQRLNKEKQKFKGAFWAEERQEFTAQSRGSLVWCGLKADIPMADLALGRNM